MEKRLPYLKERFIELLKNGLKIRLVLKEKVSN